MADLRKLNRTFVKDAPHPPNDMNRIAMSSGTLQATIEREHGDDGKHKPPFIPFAAARIIWDGASYSVGAAEGVSGVTMSSSTEVTVELSPAARTTDWGPIVWADAFESIPPRQASEVYGTRTASSVKIRLDVAASFTFQAYDRR